MLIIFSIFHFKVTDFFFLTYASHREAPDTDIYRGIIWLVKICFLYVLRMIWVNSFLREELLSNRFLLFTDRYKGWWCVYPSLPDTTSQFWIFKYWTINVSAFTLNVQDASKLCLPQVVSSKIKHNIFFLMLKRSLRWQNSSDLLLLHWGFIM